MKKKVRRLIAALLVLCCLFSFYGCVDLGAYDDESAFYASFGDIYFVCRSDSVNPEIRSYSLSDISNSETQKNDTTVMPEDYYKYIVFKTLSDINADDLVIWLLGNEEFEGNLKAEIYLSDTLLTAYRPDKTDNPYAGRYEYRTTQGTTETVEQLNFDGDGHVDDGNGHTATVQKIRLGKKYKLSFTLSYSEGGNDKEIDYVCYADDPYLSLTVSKDDGTNESETTYSFVSEYDPTNELGSAECVAEDSAYVRKGEWTSIFIEKWKDAGSHLSISEDTYIYIKILNNCAGAYRKNLSPIAFRANNLLVRVVE